MISRTRPGYGKLTVMISARLRLIASALLLAVLAWSLSGCGEKPNPVEVAKYHALMTDPLWDQLQIDGTPSDLSGNAASNDGVGGSTAAAARRWQLRSTDYDAILRSVVEQATKSGVLVDTLFCDQRNVGGTKMISGGWPAAVSISIDGPKANEPAVLLISLTLGPGGPEQFGKPSTEVAFVAGCPEDFVQRIRAANLEPKPTPTN